MIVDPSAFIEEFLQASKRARFSFSEAKIRHEKLLAPHEPTRLPSDRCAVYVFSLSEDYGSRCPAGPHRVLKVGKVGPNSNPRFQSQHYNPGSSGSNLAKSLLTSKILWPYLGITNLFEGVAGQWVKKNLDRDNFFLDAKEKDDGLRELERFLRGVLGPGFERG